MVRTPLSTQARSGGPPTGCLVVFFSIFALAGLAGFWAMTIRPSLAFVAARSWREASCVVLTSRVAESAGSKSTTYQVDVLYSYSVDGRSYQSRRYGLADSASSGRQAKEEIVASLPPGTRTTCWIDPADPGRAVISRSFSPAYLVGFFPLFFFAVGAAAITRILHPVRAAPGKPTADPSAAFGVTLPAGSDAAPVELHPAFTPLGKLVGLTLFALVWNGIVSVFLIQVYQSRGTESPDGCAIAFLVPFVLVGLLLIYATLRQLLILFNPRVHLTLSPGALAVDGAASLRWRLTGHGAGVRRLRIVLAGREEAWRQQGKSTHRESSTFAVIPVADTTQPFEIPEGSARVDLPGAIVPSFASYHCKILWSLKVTCEISGWPDSEDEYEVMVRPASGFGGAA